MKLTKYGQNALAKCIAEGFELKFSRFAIGDGEFDYETETVYELEDLKSWKMDLPLTELNVVGNGTAQITAYLSNAELTRGFAAREHGLFFLDENGEEKLFSYRNVGVNYDFIPAYTSTAHKNIFLTEEVEIRDAENITALLDLSVAYINTEDFKNHVESSAPHPNTPTKLSDVASTSAIWATDNDSHLHKISIDNLKNILRENPPAEKVNPADELGLNANLLYIEDFTTDDASDYFKTKVTSCAENGVLIGIENIQNLRTCGNYVISDGTFAEEITVISVLKNTGGYYAKIKNPLANNYKNAYLYRTTPASCKLLAKFWCGDNFSGINANIFYRVDLKTDDADITGNGVIIDDYFTLEA